MKVLQLPKTTQEKARLAIYLVYAYFAVWGLTLAYGFFLSERPEIVGATFIRIAISIAPVYYLQKTHNKWLYWIVVFLVGLYVLRGLFGVGLFLYLIFSEGLREVIGSVPIEVVVISISGLIMFILAAIAFSYLLRKQVRLYLTSLEGKQDAKA